MSEKVPEVPEVSDEQPALKVEITNQPKEKEENPTSIDTEDYWNTTLTDEEKKEMTDAQ